MISGAYDLDEKAEDKIYEYHENRENLKFADAYVKKDEEERHLDETANDKNEAKQKDNQFYADDNFPEVEMRNSKQKDSDLLGIEEIAQPKRTLQDGMH